MIVDYQFIIATGIGAFFSGLAAACITLWFQNRLLHRSKKFECLRRIAAYRRQPPPPEFTEALNEIFITFNSSSNVMATLKEFQRRTFDRGGHVNEDLAMLFRAMMDDLGMSYSDLSDDFLLTGFRTPDVPGRFTARSSLSQRTMVDEQ